MRLLNLMSASKAAIYLKKIIKFPFYIGFRRYCPVCKKYSNRFMKSGLIPRKDALCFYCHSLERHRFVWHYLTTKTDLFKNGQKVVLHVAPENCLEKRFRRLIGDSYITSDLYNDNVMIRMDITDIKFENGYFDFIYCSHVLEHVQDDQKALNEFFRVLKKDGWAIILVPLKGEKTYEDPLITSPEERLKEFGQEDHVRLYGIDITKRIRKSGFNVEVINVDDIVDRDQAVKMGLTDASGKIFLCSK